MNEIEKNLHAILSKDKDIATEIIQMCGRSSADNNISLSFQLQNDLRIRLTGNKDEESVWNSLLSILSPHSLSEDVFKHLIQNNISLLTLCHMPLQDKWLMKLIVYDDAPLYVLAKRYYLSDAYSPSDFIQFYYQCLYSRSDICLHLLELYVTSDKRKLLIFLCSINEVFQQEELLLQFRVADLVRELTDGKDILCIYEEYRSVGIVLVEIAANYFTPDELLWELSSVKGIARAREIRKNSKKTLELKRIVTEKSR